MGNTWNCPFCKAEISNEATECPACHRSLDWKTPPAPEGVQQQTQTAHVVITGVAIPFWDLVMLQVKVAIAAIPAIVILVVLAGGVALVFGGLLTAVLRSLVNQ